MNDRRGIPLARYWPILWTLATCLGMQGAAHASEAEPAPSDMPGLESFVDGVVGAVMAERRIAGAQVAIVRNGAPLLVKGYGLDRVEPRREVDPQQSLFRLGSISKTFTWIAIMQLVERGQLSLSDPVNLRLPDELDLPSDVGEPIRILDLMNHTAGFEDALQNLFSAEGSRLRPLEEQLRTRRPARVRPAGQLMAYSNYGVALAGEIIAHASGMDFETYVERNIFAPLGMSHTTFREEYAATEGLPAPMSGELAVHKAQNIERRDGRWQSVPHEHIVSMAPAGSVVSTAADMARYMAALLNPQQLEDLGVLKRDTFRALSEPSFQGAPGMPAMHHGFFNSSLGTKTRVGMDNLSHGGATLHFMSFLVVIPDVSVHAGFDQPAANGDAVGSLGIFVTTNSAAGAYLVQALPERVVAQYFPRPAEAPAAAAPQPTWKAADYVGQYRSNRRSYTRFEKILSLPAVATVSATQDGRLLVSLGPEQARFVPVGTDLFRHEAADPRIAFIRDGNGPVTQMITEIGSFSRVGFLDSMQWLILIFAIGTLATLAVVIAAVVRRGAQAARAGAARISALSMLLAAISWLVFVVLCGFWAAPLLGPSGQDRFLYTYPQPVLKVALCVLMVVAGLAIMTLATSIGVWREATWSRWRRVRHVAVVLVLVALVATLWQWNLIGLRYY